MLLPELFLVWPIFRLPVNTEVVMRNLGRDGVAPAAAPSGVDRTCCLYTPSHIIRPSDARPLNSARVCWIKHVDTPLTSRRAVTGVTPLPVARTGD